MNQIIATLLFFVEESVNSSKNVWSNIGIILVSIFIIYISYEWLVNHKIISPVIALELALSALCALSIWVYCERFSHAKLIVTLCVLGIFICGTWALCYINFPHHISHIIFTMIATGIIATAVIIAPWLALSHQRLAQETAQKEREEERADMTAHLHDSVLQTLNLIKQNSHNAEYVAHIARVQERELRRWLYEERKSADLSISSSMKLIAANIEDTYGIQIDVITVGDALPNNKTDALIEATKQALTNACLHGKTPISLYCETNARLIQTFVRDHGDGFNINSIAPDRLGIRHSIIGRIERAGGHVDIVSRAHWGTEVRMSLPLT